jgi:hypothetical protein
MSKSVPPTMAHATQSDTISDSTLQFSLFLIGTGIALTVGMPTTYSLNYRLLGRLLVIAGSGFAALSGCADTEGVPAGDGEASGNAGSTIDHPGYFGTSGCGPGGGGGAGTTGCGDHHYNDGPSGCGPGGGAGAGTTGCGGPDNNNGPFETSGCGPGGGAGAGTTGCGGPPSNNNPPETAGCGPGGYGGTNSGGCGGPNNNNGPFETSGCGPGGGAGAGDTGCGGPNNGGSAGIGTVPELKPFPVEKVGCGPDQTTPGGFGYHGSCCVGVECRELDPTTNSCPDPSTVHLGTGSGTCGCGTTEGPFAPPEEEAATTSKPCCYLAGIISCDGRPLIVDNQYLLSQLVRSSAWV